MPSAAISSFEYIVIRLVRSPCLSSISLIIAVSSRSPFVIGVIIFLNTTRTAIIIERTHIEIVTIFITEDTLYTRCSSVFASLDAALEHLPFFQFWHINCQNNFLNQHLQH